MKHANVAALGLVITFMEACGGGGGGGAPGPAAAPSAQPSSTALNAQERLAYQSWAIRTLTTKWVTDDDTVGVAGTPLPVIKRLQFVGLYPTGSSTANPSTTNFPADLANLFQCKDAGTDTRSQILINDNATFDAGESLINTYLDCKDGAFIGNGTKRTDYNANVVNYPSPNSDAVKSASFLLTYDRYYKATLPQGVFAGTQKGALDANITDFTRVYKLINMAYTYEQGSMLGNTTITISRSDNFGFDQPFNVLSITGTVQIDGTQFTVTSTPIPWRTSSSTGVAFFPQSGSLTAVGPDGEKIVTQFSLAGASCSLTPPGAAAPSVTVEKCSQI
jgi:hypothetical protein